MYPAGLDDVLITLTLLNLLGLIGLFFGFWKLVQQYRRLFPRQGSFSGKLDELFKEVDNLKEIRKNGLKYIQKVSLKRYNPYQDTGGDQSFSAAFLDGKNNGLVVTSLHNRAMTRVFAKSVKGGQKDQVEFSGEEKEVIAKAIQDH